MEPRALFREAVSMNRRFEPSIRSLLGGLAMPRWYLQAEPSGPEPELERDLATLGVRWKVVPAENRPRDGVAEPGRICSYGRGRCRRSLVYSCRVRRTRLGVQAATAWPELTSLCSPRNAGRRPTTKSRTCRARPPEARCGSGSPIRDVGIRRAWTSCPTVPGHARASLRRQSGGHGVSAVVTDSFPGKLGPRPRGARRTRHLGLGRGHNRQSLPPVTGDAHVPPGPHLRPRVQHDGAVPPGIYPDVEASPTPRGSRRPTLATR